MSYELRTKLEGFLKIRNLASGTVILDERFLAEDNVSEYQQQQIKFVANEEKVIDLTELDNKVTLFISVVEGSANIKFDMASNVYVAVKHLLLEGDVPALIIKAGSAGANVKYIVISGR